GDRVHTSGGLPIALSASPSPLSREGLKIERLPTHLEMPVGRHGPFLACLVAIKLDTVLIVIAQVKRFADAMVARAVERDPGRQDGAQRVGERRARGIENGQMIKPGAASRRRRAAGTLPGIEADVMVIAPRRNERRLVAASLHDLKAKD